MIEHDGSLMVFGVWFGGALVVPAFPAKKVPFCEQRHDGERDGQGRT
jgi:hypothetical protein